MKAQTNSFININTVHDYRVHVHEHEHDPVKINEIQLSAHKEVIQVMIKLLCWKLGLSNHHFKLHDVWQ